MSANKKEDSTPSSHKADAELSALLDSALEDFKKEPATPPPTKGDDKVAKHPETDDLKTSTSDGGEDDDDDGVVAEEWNEEFIKQSAAEFEANIASFLGVNADGTPASSAQMQQKFQEMAEAAQQAIENPTVDATSSDFASTISQTIQGLNASAEGLQTPFSDDALMNLFGGGGQGQGADHNSFLPFMQGMMQSLLSKDVLYPSLKDILDKFPDWLNANKVTLSPEDVQRYESQIKLMQSVCSELEKEIESDSVEVKQGRFEKVLSLMQKLQEFGQPPVELVGDAGPPLPLDMQNGIDPSQCSIM